MSSELRSANDIVQGHVTSSIITLFSATGASASGTFSLTTDLAVSAVTKFVIPKGLTMRVWARLVSGPAVTVNFYYSQGGSTFNASTLLFSDNLASTGELDVESRRPHLFRSSAGTEAIQVQYSGATVGTSSFVALDCELTQDPAFRIFNQI